ncbi:MAG: hypothetical protein IT222_10475 [Crocinitomix sp.]|nr:hypothetical protein [Crocinitomix sp.]
MLNTDSFLIKPFDLFTFKSKKNTSLSGGVTFNHYHFKPDFRGTGYRFFMFQPKTTNYIDDGKEMKHSNAGYIGKNKELISFKEDGLVIKTFQPNDKYQDDYLNPNEVLIELTAKFNDFDLPEMAFVGLDSTTIIKELGQQSFYKHHSLVYVKDNYALILKLKQGVVEWLRYIVLAEKLEYESAIKELFELE